jgi:Transposase
MTVVCGIDWSEQHHDVAVVDADGRLVAKRRIGDDAAGVGRLLELLAEAGDRPQAPIPVAIETARGLLVAYRRATGVQSVRSTRWRWPAIGSAMRSRARNPTTPTRWCWPTSCAPTG